LVASVISDSKNKDHQAKVDETSEPAAETDSSARVDRWFDRQLTQLYGEVTNEPIPSEILDLVNKLKSPH
jgi:hypothetical protein